MSDATLAQARATKARAVKLLTPLADVVGIGITRVGKGFGLKINLRQPPAAGVKLPKKVDGVPLTIEVVGAIDIQ
jgi:hypothetical protein